MTLPHDVVRGAAHIANRSATTVVDMVAGGMRGATTTVHLGNTVAARLEKAVNLHIKTLEAAQPLIAALATAANEGLVDDLRVALRALDASVAMVNRMGEQMDRAIALLEGTMEPARESAEALRAVTDALPGAQRDLAQLGETMERVFAMMTAPMAGFDMMAGAKRARSAFSTAAGLASGSPVRGSRDEDTVVQAAPAKKASRRRPPLGGPSKAG
jgi:hypothetical protein